MKIKFIIIFIIITCMSFLSKLSHSLFAKIYFNSILFTKILSIKSVKFNFSTFIKIIKFKFHTHVMFLQLNDILHY